MEGPSGNVYDMKLGRIQPGPWSFGPFVTRTTLSSAARQRGLMGLGFNTLTHTSHIAEELTIRCDEPSKGAHSLLRPSPLWRVQRLKPALRSRAAGSWGRSAARKPRVKVRPTQR